MEAFMKGQFFLLGALLISVMFFIGLPSAVRLVTSDVSDMEYLADNIAGEIPRSLNLGIESGSGTSGLEDFSSFLCSKADERSMVLSLIWVYTEPYGTGVRVTTGNYMGNTENIRLSVDSDQTTFQLSDSSTSMLTFSGVSEKPVLGFQFSALGKNINITRDKHNLYCYTALKRGSEMIVKEILG